MLLIQKRCDKRDHFDEILVLPFELRQKSRLRTQLVSKEEVGIFLERGTILRDGDFLEADDGRVVKVVAAPEAVIRIQCKTAEALTRVAYHLGNRHVPLQIGDGWLRLSADHVLKQMVVGLGAEVSEETEPFEPEAGAYGGADHQHHTEKGHGGIIHEFGKNKHAT